jgi:shikimate dehydrogenase
MHNAAFRELGLNAVYVAFPVTDLAQAVAGLRGLDIGGVSVTIPFKEEIIPLLDEIDPQAARMGAVNTVINQQGHLVGTNTDWLGAVAALKEKTAISGEHFLILGAGGAARAIAFAIRELGGAFAITDIDMVRAETLAREFGGEVLAPEARARGCQVIDGLQMLIHQGAAQFELWTGRTAPREVMARAAYDSLRA